MDTGLLQIFADIQLVPLRYAARRLGRESSNDLSLHVLGPLSKTFSAIQEEHGAHTGWLYIWLPEHLAWLLRMRRGRPCAGPWGWGHGTDTALYAGPGIPS